MTCWWLPRPPSGLHHHQQVLATRWTVPPASFCLPTTINESRRLVGRFPSLHLPFHHHQQRTFTHYHVPATSHLTTHTSHHYHQPVTSPHPTGTTRHVTRPTFSNRAGKTKKG